MLLAASLASDHSSHYSEKNDLYYVFYVGSNKDHDPLDKEGSVVIKKDVVDGIISSLVDELIIKPTLEPVSKFASTYKGTLKSEYAMPLGVITSMLSLAMMIKSEDLFEGVDKFKQGIYGKALEIDRIEEFFATATDGGRFEASYASLKAPFFQSLDNINLLLTRPEALGDDLMSYFIDKLDNGGPYFTVGLNHINTADQKKQLAFAIIKTLAPREVGDSLGKELTKQTNFFGAESSSKMDILHRNAALQNKELRRQNLEIRNKDEQLSAQELRIAELERKLLALERLGETFPKLSELSVPSTKGLVAVSAAPVVLTVENIHHVSL